MSSPSFLCLLSFQADLAPASLLTSKQQKTSWVYQSLRQVAENTQPLILQQLSGSGCRFTTFTVVNAIALKCSTGNEASTILDSLSANPAIARIEADSTYRLSLPQAEDGSKTPKIELAAVPWNLSIIRAPEAWSAGFRGQNVVIGNQDTGFQWDHPAILQQYRGWTESTVNHNYQWWDAIHEHIQPNNNPCGYNLIEPCDDSGHGTHTMGIAVGNDHQNNIIGVAPEAKWIGCRNMDSGVGRPSSYLECFDFFLAPWDLKKKNANPALSPDVINNSWACPGSEGCSSTSLLEAVNHVRAAGILVAVAAGNSGANGCGSINEEPAFFDSSTTIGSTNSIEQISAFSSIGPVTIDGSNRIKPDLSAPGDFVRSSWLASSYAYKSGTSMATPHFAGAAAILLSAFPQWKGKVDQVEQVFFQSAVPLKSNIVCDQVSTNSTPNPVFGWGRIDVMGALQKAGYKRTIYMPAVSREN